MTTQHPITPPPELVEQWLGEQYGVPTAPGEATSHVATQAAQWGADQELEACCAWLPKWPPCRADDLRRHRRPKPPSLKEQAFQALCRFQAAEGHEGCTEEEIVDDFNTISRALEALPE
jgi:hypothetical protein